MTTNMREALTAAFEKETENATTEQTTETTSTDELAASQTDSEVSGSQNGTEDGKSPAAAEKSDGAQSAAEKSAAPVESKSDPAAGVHRVDRAPASWKKEAKGEWASVPLHIRQEVHRREMEINRALNEATHRGQAAQQFEQAAQPYMARIQSLGVSPQQAFEHLLRADYSLATGNPQQKAMLVDKLLQDYGVDIAMLDQVIAARLGGGQQQQSAPQAPDIQALVQQQLQQALAPIYQQQQAQQQQVAQEAVQSVEQMSLDPKYPFFEEVRGKMATLIESGLAVDLPSAYNYAVSMTPELNRMNLATQSNQVAQRARAASASISGSPVGGGAQVHVSGGDLRSDIEAAFGGARL